MNLLPDNEWDIYNIPPEQINVCHRWEFSRTAVLEADPSYVHEGIDPYAKYGEFASPWPHLPFIALDLELRKSLASNYHPQRQGLWPLDYRHFVKNYDDAAPQSLFAFQIDWTCPPDKLKDDFLAWMKDNRPSGIEVQEVRGHAPIRQMEADLKALGIYRIVQFHHATPVSAIIDKYKTSFRDETAWSKAKGRAIRELKSFR